MSSVESFHVQNINPLIQGQPLSKLQKKQLYLLTEGLFLEGFKRYELAVEAAFILYLMEAKSVSGKKPHSFLKPQNKLHARQMIKSSSQYIEWSKPNQNIARSELFLKDGFQLKSAMTSYQSNLTDCLRVRNHIAHSSEESEIQYKKVLQSKLNTLPLKIPTVGEFLLKVQRSSGDMYFDIYIQTMRNTISVICN